MFVTRCSKTRKCRPSDLTASLVCKVVHFLVY